jgi:LmbE family N-acetylglucosaminyl deacetylase
LRPNNTGGIQILNFLRKVLEITRTNRNISSLTNIIKTNTSPSLENIAGLPPQNVLVLAPHPDDEVMGCGGTIIKHRIKGSRILIIYLTDGREGGINIDHEVLSNLRKEEAKAGLRIIGCSEYLFMDYPDSRLGQYIKECSKRLATVIADFQPDSIFVPNFLDVHPDHVATARILARALKNEGGKSFCYSYEVYATIVPNTIVDISDVMNTKLEALKEHKSQLSHIDFVQKIEGLNSYRSIYLGNSARYCEVFLKNSQSGYIRILKGI